MSCEWGALSSQDTQTLYVMVQSAAADSVQADLCLFQRAERAAGRHLHAPTLADKAVGMLVMPLVTEAGFGVGGAYGRGALIVGGATVDYYAQAKASFGLQLGAQ